MELEDSRADGGRRYLLDNRDGRMKVGGHTRLTWHSFQEFDLDTPDEAAVAFIGSKVAERVRLVHLGYDGARTVRVDTKGGDDEVHLNGIDHGSVRAGAGADRLRIDSTQSVTADLESGTVDTVRPNALGTTHVDVGGVENLATTRVRQVTLTGDERDNRLSTANACTSVLRGGAGDDVLDANAQFCSYGTTPKHQLFGDTGDDHLDGSKVDDLLDGGAGDDFAYGSGGTDTCLAEVRKACEI
jgi:Ca2+-binding RTX toxin-like protein